LVLSGASTPPSPLGAESATLASIRASPSVRLARTKITTSEIAGIERALAVLFLDVRAFTQLCKSKLPRDVV
jgi:hypothetical protein